MEDANEPTVTKSNSSFVLLWNPDYFAWEAKDRLEMLACIEAGELPEDEWSMTANVRNVQVGDRLYLRRTGRGNRGIVAAGRVQGEAIIQPHWDKSGRGTTYIPLVWDSIVDSDSPLNLQSLAEAYPSGVWSGMQSGMRVPDEAAVALERAWREHFGKALQESQSLNGTEPTGDSPIERKYVESLIKTRRHQRSFRAMLLRNRELRCEFGECTVTDPRMLEAAHIVPDSAGGESSLENGLLLCRNHHRALDVNILEFDGDHFYWADDVEPF